jgi:hypothetical protein
MADMDKLVGKTNRLGIITQSDLGEYHRQFYTITTYLIGKARLSVNEQGRAFMRGFSASLQERIRQRLQLKLADHHPDDPYTLNEIHEAARFVLYGTAIEPQRQVEEPIVAPTAPSSSIKNEELASIIEAVTMRCIQAFAQTQGRPRNPAPANAPGQNAQPTDRLCRGCGKEGHYIRECPDIAQGITNGLCRRDVYGRVILSSGADVP